MIKEKVLLAQFHDIKDDDDGSMVTEYIKDPEGKRPDLEVKGLILYSLHNYKSELLTQYNAKDDKTDLEPVKDILPDAQIVFVNKTTLGGFEWKTFEVDQIEGDIFTIKNLRLATEEEVKILDDELYPEFFDNCY